MSKVDEVLENFPFKTVLKEMERRNHVWISGKPTLFTLRQTAKSLLRKLETSVEEFGATSTGGLHAYKFPWGYSLHYCPMEFTYRTY